MTTIICALASDRAIGYDNRLLFRQRADMMHFKELTTGHTVIMGRKTWESFPVRKATGMRALPNRRNIVLTRNADYVAEGAEVFASLEEALAACRHEDIFIIGGASVYNEALPLADRLCLTHVHGTPDAADAYFPEFSPSEWRLIKSEDFPADDDNEHPYTFADYERA